MHRGVINEVIFTQYLQITQAATSLFAEYGAEFANPDTEQQAGLLWTLTEAREGSTVLEFVLQAWGYSAAIAGPVGALLAAYPKMADGWERLKKDMQSQLKSWLSEKVSCVNKVTFEDNIKDEIEEWLASRDKKH